MSDRLTEREDECSNCKAPRITCCMWCGHAQPCAGCAALRADAVRYAQALILAWGGVCPPNWAMDPTQPMLMAERIRARGDELQGDCDALRAEASMLRSQLRSAEDGRAVDKMNAEADARAGCAALREALKVIAENTGDRGACSVATMALAQSQPDGTPKPAGSFGYCAVCYHPLDRCSHCDQPDGTPRDE